MVVGKGRGEGGGGLHASSYIFLGSGEGGAHKDFPREGAPSTLNSGPG